MSIQGTSLGGAQWSMNSRPPRMKPPDMSQDDLKKMQEKMKSEGKDTSNLDKIIANFTDLDTDQSGTVSREELDAAADKFGIEKPKGHPPKPPGGWGPPPGLLEQGAEQGTDDSSSSSSCSGDDAKSKSTSKQDQMTALLEQMLKSFKALESDQQNASSSSSVNVAA